MPNRLLSTEIFWRRTRVQRIRVSENVGRVVCGRVLFDDVTETSVELPDASDLFVLAMVAGSGGHRLSLRDDSSVELDSLCLKSSGTKPCFMCGVVSEGWPPDADSVELNAVGLSLLASQAKGGDKNSEWRLRLWCERRTRSMIAKSKIGRLLNAEEEIVDRVLNRVHKYSIPKFDPNKGTWPGYFRRVYTSVISSHLPGDGQVVHAIGDGVQPADPHPGPLYVVLKSEDASLMIKAITEAELTDVQRRILTLELSGIPLKTVVKTVSKEFGIPEDEVRRERAKAIRTIQRLYFALGGK